MRSSDQGAVTAEAAMVIPVLVAFAMALVWALVASAASSCSYPMLNEYTRGFR